MARAPRRLPPGLAVGLGDVADHGRFQLRDDVLATASGAFLDDALSRIRADLSDGLADELPDALGGGVGSAHEVEVEVDDHRDPGGLRVQSVLGSGLGIREPFEQRRGDQGPIEQIAQAIAFVG